jgi:hypothetical protein
MQNDAELQFAAYLRTGDLELLRKLSDRHVARLVDEGRFEEVYQTWPLSLVMHRRLDHVRRVMRQSLGLPVAGPVDGERWAASGLPDLTPASSRLLPAR